ncbi:MAG: hypothetical protein WBA89_09925, partial [Microcoleus sp.]
MLVISHIVSSCIGIIKSIQQSTVNSQQSVGAVPRVPALLTVNNQQSTVSRGGAKSARPLNSQQSTVNS